ncbi:MAG: HIT family protein [Thermoanaerobaculia bacterium]|nr:HIT family protein [Thermoanaerobaculia bacterium]
MNCIFCDLLTTRESAADILFEDDDVLVLLHEAWATLGHTVVVAKRHVENSSELPAGEWARVARAFQRVEAAVLATTGADRAILMKLGLMVPHLHIHIYPVSRTMTREQVFAVIDGKTKHEATAEEKAVFVEALRKRILAELA